MQNLHKKREQLTPDGYAVKVIKHPSMRFFGILRGLPESFEHRNTRGEIYFVGAVNAEERQAYICLGHTWHPNLMKQLVMNGIPRKTATEWETKRAMPGNQWSFFNGRYERRRGEFAAEDQFREEPGYMMGSREWKILRVAVRKIHGKKASDTLVDRDS
ncbi:MAG: hypothetical protein V1787_05295 [Candidatus Micrarchaeota archaeon]